MTTTPAAAPAMRLSWSVHQDLGETVRQDGTVILRDATHPIWSYRVVVEAHDPQLGQADDPDAWVEQGGQDGFDVDPHDPSAPDPESPDPYIDAEDRLLEALGLARDQIREVIGPW